MSRKSLEDQSAWAMPSLYAFVGDYGHFKVKGFEPIENALIWLCNTHTARSEPSLDKDGHVMLPFASVAQDALLKQVQPLGQQMKDNIVCSQGRFKTIFILDIKDMFDTVEDYEAAMFKEMEQQGVTKLLGKKVLRLFQRLALHQVAVAAEGNLSALLLKIYRAVQHFDDNMISEVWLVHPNLSTTFVNTHLVPHLYNSDIEESTSPDSSTSTLAPTSSPRTSEDKPPMELNIIAKKSCNRASILKHYFKIGKLLSVEGEADGVEGRTGGSVVMRKNWFVVISNGQEDITAANTPTPYDPGYCNDFGKMLFMSSVEVRMNRHSKQYERICRDSTADLVPPRDHAKPTGAPSYGLGPRDKNEDTERNNPLAAIRERHVGALVLRGNRCVLARSLRHEWKGMRLPSVVPQNGESALDASIRAMVEFTEVEPTQVQAMPNILPVPVYAPNGRSILMELYPLYATDPPPPDGPLEDADMEDDESPYDWYTFPNAIARLDKSSIAGLQSMVLNLIQAANVGLLPAKWGGVFGQELYQALMLPQHQQDHHSPHLPILLSQAMILDAELEEWEPSRQGDVGKDLMKDVRKANQALAQHRSKGCQKGGRSSKLPVTLLSGFLGSGKTTLLTHILSNYQDLKVAILVNDMGEVNIDAALIHRNGSVSVRHREEHLIELSNGCICCTLREDLLVEVANIAADPSFDYLIIESSGISEPLPVAETFTFEDSNGLRLGDIAELDTLVTVVDGSKFLDEMDSLEFLHDRNWHAVPEDERTISHLLCDQVEFSNVIVLNKCDLIKTPKDKQRVKALISKMNPSAQIVEAKFSKVPLHCVLGTRLFAMSEAQKHEKWLQEARIGEHKPETEEYGIQSFTYRARRPFMPGKLHGILDAILNQTQQPFDKNDANIVIRAKGFVWLASCPQLQGEFSLAGSRYSLTPGNPWWAEIDRSHWPDNLDRQIAPLWHEPYGDRQQEIVFIGQSLDKDAIARAFDQCLVPLESMECGQCSWDSMVLESGDPFRDSWEAAIAMAQAQRDHVHDHYQDHDHAE